MTIVIPTDRRLLPHIFVDGHLRYRGGVDVAVRISGDAFRRRVFRVFHRRRGNIAIDLAGLHAAETDAALAAGIVGVLAGRILGFGIRNVEHVVLVDEDAARPAELLPRAEKFSVLIEERDAAIAAVGDEKPAGAIERQHMRAFQLAIARPPMAARLCELYASVALR